MNNYRRMLIARAQKADQSQPVAPEKPLTWTQYKNKLHVASWKARLREFKMAESWT